MSVIDFQKKKMDQVSQRNSGAMAKLREKVKEAKKEQSKDSSGPGM